MIYMTSDGLSGKCLMILTDIRMILCVEGENASMMMLMFFEGFREAQRGL